MVRLFCLLLKTNEKGLPFSFLIHYGINKNANVEIVETFMQSAGLKVPECNAALCQKLTSASW